MCKLTMTRHSLSLMSLPFGFALEWLRSAKHHKERKSNIQLSEGMSHRILTLACAVQSSIVSRQRGVGQAVSMMACTSEHYILGLDLIGAVLPLPSLPSGNLGFGDGIGEGLATSAARPGRLTRVQLSCVLAARFRAVFGNYPDSGGGWHLGAAAGSSGGPAVSEIRVARRDRSGAPTAKL